MGAINNANVGNIVKGYDYFKKLDTGDSSPKTISPQQIFDAIQKKGQGYLQSLLNEYANLSIIDDDDGFLLFNNSHLTLSDLKKGLLAYVKDKLGLANKLYGQHDDPVGDLITNALKEKDTIYLEILQALNMDIDRDGNTPMHFAVLDREYRANLGTVRTNYNHHIEYLFHAGYKTDVENRFGDTPRSIAAQNTSFNGTSHAIQTLNQLEVERAPKKDNES